jgi:hypothetical protein
MSERKNLNTEQRHNTASRIIHDAELLKHGAGIDVVGNVDPSPRQKSELYRKHVLEPQRVEFLEKTPDGQVISAHIDKVRRLHTAVAVALGNAAHFHAHDIPVVDEFRDDAGVLELDFDRLDDEGADGTARKDEYLHELDRRDYVTPLNDLALGLMEHPELGTGNQVTVLRNGYNGEPDRREAGWQVSDILLNGELRVTHDTPKGPLTKEAPIDVLQSWNAIPAAAQS